MIRLINWDQIASQLLFDRPIETDTLDALYCTLRYQGTFRFFTIAQETEFGQALATQVKAIAAQGDIEISNFQFDPSDDAVVRAIGLALLEKVFQRREWLWQQ